jgi:hypothetical protein
MQSQEKMVASPTAVAGPLDVRTGDAEEIKLPSFPPVRVGSPAIADDGRVRLGGAAPAL